MNEDTLTIGVLLFEGAEELDVAGPWEVLGFWAAHIASSPVRVLTLGPRAGVVRCAKGLGLVADHDLTTAPPLDLLVHPGGDGTRSLVKEELHLAWLRELRRQGTVLASVCTGSLVLAAAGLLADRPATTHRNHLDKLAKIDSSVDLRAGNGTSTPATSSPPPAYRPGSTWRCISSAVSAGPRSAS
ncbi:hypothetical protein GCM10010317_094870 [Streptomyces mirabilis]|uniref:DJ-1/PfpI family protein n=1 Tax=Streptomyces mirabilis TaxID=68239 RepID=UPI0019C44A9B|nr:DJ-1/PfpI family protein [Streptomyces mirabilis]GHD77240.1 hypothetical protein GCM10010317_094870 [Streptomyces mirabilis]